MRLNAVVILGVASVCLVGVGCSPDQAAKQYAEREKRKLSRLVAPEQIQVWANQIIAENWTNSPGLVIPISSNKWPGWLAQSRAGGGFFGAGINLRESRTNSFVAIGWGSGAGGFWGLYVGQTNLALPFPEDHKYVSMWFPGCYIWVSGDPWSP